MKKQWGESHTPNHLKSKWMGDEKAHERAENLHRAFRRFLIGE